MMSIEHGSLMCNSRAYLITEKCNVTDGIKSLIL